ncbi:MAG: hypothetical protein QM778_10935 [Myxococcales bacterium]
MDDDLQLIAEAVARPGETLAVRALLLEHVDDPSGPGLGLRPVEVRLLDEHSRVLAQTTLTPRTLTSSMEGELRLPANLEGRASLVANVELENGSRLECQRSLQIARDAPVLVAQPRMSGPLQTLAIGPARPTQATLAPPTPFLPRIVGGACPPEERCTILVWVGEPASAVVARVNAQVSVPSPSSPSVETAGFVALEVIPHGLEAQLTLEARRAGVLVAERQIRLPVALGEVGVSVRTPLLEPLQAPELSFTLPPGRSQAIVDAFAGGRWRASGSFAQSEVVTRLPSEWARVDLLTRIQVRSDRFSSEGAGSRMLYRRAEGESPEQALRRLSSLIPELETMAWSGVLPEFAGAEPQRAAAFLMAPLELLRVPLPDAHSARPVLLARLERKRAFLRFGVAAVLVLAAIVVAISLMRRGLSATEEARAILDQARGIGETGEVSSETSQGSRLGVILLVLAVVLAFLAGALLIVAKPLWF